MSTLALPPDEFALLRKVCAMIAGSTPAEAARAFTAAELREFIGEHITTVGPGETLVVQVGSDWTPSQVRELHEWLNWGWDDDAPAPVFPFRSLVVPGEALGKVSQSGLDDAVRRIVREEIAAARKRELSRESRNPARKHGEL